MKVLIVAAGALSILAAGARAQSLNWAYPVPDPPHQNVCR